MEDKQRICDLLACTLKETRQYGDLTGLAYDEDTEIVKVFFEGSEHATLAVNVACDSGIAMINDIVSALR